MTTVTSPQVPVVEVALAQVDRNRRPLVGWSMAVAAIAALYTGFWPAFDGETLQALTDDLPPALVDALGYQGIATAEGWLTSTIYGLLGPLVLLTFAIGFGARSMAGDERDGIVALELVQPMARRAVALGRLGAGAALLAVIVTVLTLATFVTASIVGMGVGAWRFVGAGLALWVFVLPWLVLSWAVAAGSGRRDVAVGTAATLAALAYVVHVLGAAVDIGWADQLSPFHWYLETDPLVRGVDQGLVVSALVSVVVMAVAGVVGFERRDIAS